MKKQIFVLQVNGHNKAITELTFPYIEKYAKKVGAEIAIISEDKYPDLPKVYNKFQVYELGKGNDWNIYIDSDALIHPDCPDWTNHLDKDTVLFHGKDMASIRWKYDEPFWKDGRNIGACTWFIIASNLTHNLWRPLEDITFEQAVENIYPTVAELKTVKTKESLIDDYTMSRNIAIYGLKHKTVMDLHRELGLAEGSFYYHEYLLTPDEKIIALKAMIKKWES